MAEESPVTAGEAEDSAETEGAEPDASAEEEGGEPEEDETKSDG